MNINIPSLRPWNEEPAIPIFGQGKPVFQGEYILGEIRPEIKQSRGSIGIPVENSLGVWDLSTGEFIFGIRDTRVLDFVPKKNEVALIREELRQPSVTNGVSRKDYRWLFERYAIPTGKKLSSYEIDERWNSGWLLKMTFLKKYKEKVVKVSCGDEDHPYSFYITISAEGDSEFRIDEAEINPEEEAKNLYTAAERLEVLAQSSDFLAVLVAQNKATPLCLLEQIAEHKLAEVRSQVARHGNSSVALQKKLAHDPEIEVRASITLISQYYDPVKKKFERVAPALEVLQQLASDPEPKVRAAAARVIKDPESLSELAKDPSATVRIEVIRWNLPLEIELILAADPDSKIRLKFCESRDPKKCGRKESIYRETLEVLLQDKNASVRKAASKLSPFLPSS